MTPGNSSMSTPYQERSDRRAAMISRDRQLPQPTSSTSAFSGRRRGISVNGGKTPYRGGANPHHALPLSTYLAERSSPYVSTTIRRIASDEYACRTKSRPSLRYGGWLRSRRGGGPQRRRRQPDRQRSRSPRPARHRSLVPIGGRNDGDPVDIASRFFTIIPPPTRIGATNTVADRYASSTESTGPTTRIPFTGIPVHGSLPGIDAGDVETGCRIPFPDTWPDLVHEESHSINVQVPVERPKKKDGGAVVVPVASPDLQPAWVWYHLVRNRREPTQVLPSEGNGRRLAHSSPIPAFRRTARPV